MSVDMISQHILVIGTLLKLIPMQWRIYVPMIKYIAGWRRINVT